MENKDYYDYWNKERPENKKFFDREIKSLGIVKKVIRDKKMNFIDLGCGNGQFIETLLKLCPNISAKGVEFSKAELNEAKKRGIKASFGDFSIKINEKNESFDFAYAGEVIEHLYDPDLFLSEINRILKKDGYVLITTPNLLAWYNRIFALLGIQPLFLEPSTKSKLVGAGILAKFKKESQPVGHIRIFTIEAMKDLLNMNGFEVKSIRGGVYDAGLPKSMLSMDRIMSKFTPLSSHMIVLARKVKNN